MERGLTRQHRATWFRRHRSCSGFQDKPAEKLKNRKKNGDESNLGVWGVLSSCTVVRLRQISPEKERLLNKQDKRSMEAIIICQWQEVLHELHNSDLMIGSPSCVRPVSALAESDRLGVPVIPRNNFVGVVNNSTWRFYLETFSLLSSHKLCILKLSSGSDSMTVCWWYWL